MDFEAIRSLIEVKQQKSLSKASKLLHISQPALSKQIQRLEADLEVTILKRSAQGVELTEAGELFLSRMEPILKQINEVKMELRGYQVKKKISLGILPSLAAHYISRYKGILEKTYEVEWYIEHTKILMELFKARKIDAMLIDSSVDDAKYIRKVRQEHIVCVVSSKHIYKGKKIIKVSDLQHEKLIIYPEICDVRKMIMTVFQGVGVKPTIAVETPYAEPMLAMVRAGVGITLLPEIAVKQGGKEGICMIPIEPALTRCIYFVSHREEETFVQIFGEID
ncbi:LysR family transcriptional regulator [Bacillus cytotoxicus]|uniref:LysR family transcriptional regulator n=1 Tax=Bacillus cytotoxicus TaxID=580165 RepID=UPI0024483726|nr:LysR family transcriptional regulator [Bacillus cytotoxicus]MDH2868533.1 LysR family transcriptional regulator [Bacillus cytotoxicus]